MWLSDAMRLGCAMKPQAFGDFFRDGGSCALGAAQDGFLASCYSDDDVFRKQRWENERCPECGMNNKERQENYSTYAMIPHLNDCHKMSREEIADLVESWEVKYEGRHPREAIKPDPLADIFPATKEEHDAHMKKIYQEELAAASV